MPASVELTGADLTIDDVWDVAVERRPVALARGARERVARSRGFLESQVGDHTYGVNTGFGRFVSEVIPPERSTSATPATVASSISGRVNGRKAAIGR